MRVYLGCDHAGFTLKESVKSFLEKSGYEVADLGAFSYDERDDYPDFIMPVAKAIAHDLVEGKESRGIIFGGSGQGEAMVANRVTGVRAAVFYGPSTSFDKTQDKSIRAGGHFEIVKLSREHNNANVLSLGARFVSEKEALEVIELWLNTPFSGDDRHMRRIMKF